MLKRWVGLLVALGCATTGPVTFPAALDRTGEEQAVHIVWAEVYGRSDRPPLVRWREGAQLDCDEPRSGRRGFLVVTTDASVPDSATVLACRLGTTWSALEVVVAWHGELSFSETGLAEELEHAELLRRGIYSDHHGRADFFTRIAAARAALVAAGR